MSGTHASIRRKQPQGIWTLSAVSCVPPGRYWTGSLQLKQGSLPHATANLRAGVGAISWLGKNPDSSLLVSGSDDGSIDLWQSNLDEGKLDHLDGKAGHDHIVSGISASSTSNIVATSSWDWRVRLWIVGAFLESWTSFVGHTDLVHSVAWGDAGGSEQSIYSASQDRTVRQWDVRQSSAASVLRLQHPATVVTMCDAHMVAVGDEMGSLTFFDSRNGSVQLGALPKLHHDTVRALARPLQGSKTLIASAGDDGRVCIIPQGPQISATKQQVHTPHRDGSYIRALGYGRKGLYSAGWDGQIECTAVTSA